SVAVVPGIGISVAAMVTTAEASPTVRAYLGDDAEVTAGDDVLIEAVGEAYAISDALGFSGSTGVGVAGASVTSTVNPTVKAFTVGGGSITASDDVTIAARVNVDASGNNIQPTWKGNAVGPA